MEEKKKPGVIGVGCSKGYGTTTLVILLASYLEERGFKVGLVDANFENFSLFDYHNEEGNLALNDDRFKAFIKEQGKDITHCFPIDKVSMDDYLNDDSAFTKGQKTSSCDYIIVDLPSYGHLFNERVFAQLDFFICPCQMQLTAIENNEQMLTSYFNYVVKEKKKLLSYDPNSDEALDLSSNKIPLVINFRYGLRNNDKLYMYRYYAAHSFVNYAVFIDDFIAANKSLRTIYGSRPFKNIEADTEVFLSARYGVNKRYKNVIQAHFAVNNIIDNYILNDAFTKDKMLNNYFVDIENNATVDPISLIKGNRYSEDELKKELRISDYTYNQLLSLKDKMDLNQTVSEIANSLLIIYISSVRKAISPTTEERKQKTLGELINERFSQLPEETQTILKMLMQGDMKGLEKLVSESSTENQSEDKKTSSKPTHTSDQGQETDNKRLV